MPIGRIGGIKTGEKRIKKNKEPWLIIRKEALFESFFSYNKRFYYLAEMGKTCPVVGSNVKPLACNAARYAC